MTNLAIKTESNNIKPMAVVHNTLNENIRRIFNDDKIVRVQDCDLIRSIYYVNYQLVTMFQSSEPEDVSIEVSEADFKNWITANKINEWTAYGYNEAVEDVISYEAHEADIDKFLFDNNSICEDYGIMKEYIEHLRKVEA